MRTRAELVPASPSRRTAICLSCRTALHAGEACDVDPAHRVASLAESTGRELLVDAAWGPPDVRLGEARLALRCEQAVTALGLAGFAGGLLALWLVLPGLGPLHVLGAALSMALFWGGGNLFLGRRGGDFPSGARPLRAAIAVDRLGLRGIANGDASLESPASGGDCLAFVLELHFVGHGGDRVMYRDAITCGFDILLDDGRMARIPPGRIRLIAPARQVIDVDNLSLERYLLAVDRQHEQGRPFDPLRYNVAAEALLLAGDAVELLSSFEPEVNVRAAPTGYRDPAPSVWVARDIPTVRVLDAG